MDPYWEVGNCVEILWPQLFMIFFNSLNLKEKFVMWSKEVCHVE